MSTSFLSNEELNTLKNKLIDKVPDEKDNIYKLFIMLMALSDHAVEVKKELNLLRQFRRNKGQLARNSRGN